MTAEMAPEPPKGQAPAWVERARGRVNERLRVFLHAKVAEARALAPDGVQLVEEVAALTLRGGKRIRPAFIAAAYDAVTAGEDDAPCVSVGAAMELLQSSLLIHDDWMDGDDQRRGGPSTHAALVQRHGDAHLGACLGVLAGDLAAAFCHELLAAAPFPPQRWQAAMEAFWRMEREVYYGQCLDLLAAADVERMYDLKTGSYTVRGPLRLGALLADASANQLQTLERFGKPLGVAFQLRDELLATFGDPAVTGKPAGNDLRAGKLTTLVADARQSVPPSERRALERVFGKREASDEDVACAVELLRTSGAQRRAERRLDTLVAEARDVLTGAPLRADRLEELIGLVAVRDR